MTSRTSVVLALVADNVTNLMPCFLLLLAMMWASVVCERGQELRRRDGHQHAHQQPGHCGARQESQLKQLGVCLYTKDNATHKAGKAAKSSANPNLLSFMSNSADAFRGTLRSAESLERAAEWTQLSLVAGETSPSQESSNTDQRGADPRARGTTARSLHAVQKRTST